MINGQWVMGNVIIVAAQEQDSLGIDFIGEK